MKSIIFGLALIAVVACDVSHLQGQGWSKDESGYNYPQPAIKFDPAPELVEEEIVEQPEIEIIADEQCINGGSGPFCCINGADNEDCAIAEAVVADAPIAEVTNDYLPPVTNDYLPPLNNEYLPPAEALKLRKRQILAKRQIPQVRRVYRRVYRRL